MRIPFMRQVCWYLVFAMCIIAVAPKAEAGFSPSESIVLSQTDRDADMQKVQTFLETKIVQQRLADYGLTQEEISSRLSEMSDQQIHQVATQVDEVKVGGIIGVVIGVLVIILLVIVILKLTGHKVAITH
ncbi:MAG: PA2779 family protein [Dissulfurispiraceae bacterium]|nr:PA2779 family protein [Dissulfurispiraceae bacterium]